MLGIYLNLAPVLRPHSGHDGHFTFDVARTSNCDRKMLIVEFHDKTLIRQEIEERRAADAATAASRQGKFTHKKINLARNINLIQS